MASTKTTNAVISYLLEYGDSPRIDIAKALSLTKASVTLVTNDMLEKGVIVEKGEVFDDNEKTIRGRRKILLSINPDYKVTIGVALLKNKLMIGVTNLNGDVFAKKTIEYTPLSYDELVDEIVKQVEIISKDNLIEAEDILATGIVLSKSSSDIIEGETLDDKIEKIKLDLSQKAISNIVVGSIAKSCLMAQRVFTRSNCTNSVMVLSMIDNLDIGICINSNLFSGKNNSSGGYKIIEKALLKYQYDNDVEAFTDTVSFCLSVMDVHNVYGIGGVLSDNDILDKINKKVETKTKIISPIMCSDTLFLSGCGQALYQCLAV